MTELGLATFASSVRSGRMTGSAALAAKVPRLVVDQSVTVSAVGGSTENAVTRLEMLGPGDVVGIAPDEVLRVFPLAGEPAAEPNYLAGIEFDSPELPWALSLTVGADRVMPWVALVVVPDRGNRVDDRPGSMLPWLIATGEELPPSDETWAWAHAHAQGDASLAQPGPDDGRRTLSRLLCPTRLQPVTAYLAAVVPTYEAGVLAAMRQSPAGAGDRRSWMGDEDTVTLPMYHHWRFTTGTAGDFEELARQLTPVDASTIDGLGRLDLKSGGAGLGDVPAEADLLPVRTLLVSPAEDAARDKEAAEQVRGDLSEPLTAALQPPGDRERMVLPPRYGEWPAGEAQLEDGPAWYRELNLQPHQRVIARVGADIVRAQQEELVAEAQRQLGQYLLARRARDLLRLGEMTATRIHRRAIAGVSDERLVTAIRPVLDALVTSADAAVVDSMSAQGFGTSLLTGSVMRIARRAAVRSGEPVVSLRTAFVSGSMDATLQPTPELTLAPAIDIDRAQIAFGRAGILDHLVSGVRIEQLFALAPDAQRAEDHLLTALRDHTIDVQRVPDEVVVPPVAEPAVVEPAVVEPQAFDPHILARHVEIQPHALNPEIFQKLKRTDLQGGVANLHRLGKLPDFAPPDAVAADAAAPEMVVPAVLDVAVAAMRMADAPGLMQLRGGFREVVAQVDPDGADAVSPDRFRFPTKLPEALLTQRLDTGVKESLAGIVATAMAELQVKAVAVGVPEAAAVPFEDLIVDRDTVAVALDQPGTEQGFVQLGAREVVRRNLGLHVVPPVLRDLLTVDAQQEFDHVVTELAARQIGPAIAFPAAPARVTIGQVAAHIRPRLEVSETYRAALKARLTFVGEGTLPSGAAMGFVPRFDAPLVERLRRSLGQWILAGAERVPPNAITLVLTNPAFVEALIAGANHEVAREMLWRDIPADPRGTSFRRFWGASPHEAEGFRAIHEWTSRLGGNLGAESPYICVVVRSPLLRKYPHAVVQAAQGTLTPRDGGRNFEPDATTITPLLFQGAIAPDLTFSVLALTEEQVREAQPGMEWYILLGEPVTEPKFGLDSERTAGVEPQSWRDLAWTDVTDGTALRVADARLKDFSFEDLPWGRTAAGVARILHQDPFRLVLPAAEFLRIEV